MVSVHFQACNFHLQTTKKVCSFLRTAVHFDFKPQIVMLQNICFVLTSFKHEGLCIHRFWNKQEACASIGPRTNNSEQERRSCTISSATQLTQIPPKSKIPSMCW